MNRPVLIETSARHIHVSRRVLDILFGEGYELTNKKDLSQPGQYACEERVQVIGPKGEVELNDGVIIAKRHIHMTPADAEKYNLVDKQIVSVKADSDGRALIFGDVIVRVSPSYALAMHIDTDESNAASCTPGMEGDII